MQIACPKHNGVLWSAKLVLMDLEALDGGASREADFLLRMFLNHTRFSS